MKASPTVKIRVPGKVMLSGEYAVLYGGRSLAIAIDRYMTICVTPRDDGRLVVDSELWPQPFDAYDASVDPRFHQSPLGKALEWLRDHGKQLSADLVIRSDLRPEDGFGSSSAVSLGALMALYLASEAELRRVLPREQNLGQFALLWKLAGVCWQLQRERQPAASGYDFLCQALGAITILRPDEAQWPGSYHRYQSENSHRLPITIYRGGRGAPTSMVMADTLHWLGDRNLHQDLLHASEAFTEQVKSSFFSDNGASHSEALYASCGQFRDIFAGSPHYPHALLDPLKEMDGCDRSWSFKTTGAGGEDALLVFGEADDIQPVHTHLANAGWIACPFNIDQTGLAVLA